MEFYISLYLGSHEGIQIFYYNSKPHSTGPHQPAVHLHFKYLGRAAAGTIHRRSPASEWCLVLIFPSWSSHLPSCCRHRESWCSNPGIHVWSSLQCSPSRSHTHRSETDMYRCETLYTLHKDTAVFKVIFQVQCNLRSNYSSIMLISTKISHFNSSLLFIQKQIWLQ